MSFDGGGIRSAKRSNTLEHIYKYFTITIPEGKPGGRYCVIGHCLNSSLSVGITPKA